MNATFVMVLEPSIHRSLFDFWLFKQVSKTWGLLAQLQAWRVSYVKMRIKPCKYTVAIIPHKYVLSQLRTNRPTCFRFKRLVEMKSDQERKTQYID